MREDIRDILETFFLHVKNDIHSTNNFCRFYYGTKMKVGFGVGKTARIPWVTFLKDDQTPQDGIFPVYYFFKENHKLILAYGISETNIPQKKWLVPLGTKTVAQYFIRLGIKPYKYGSSYVYEVYDTNKEFDWDKIEIDLDTLIEKYKEILKR